MDQQCSNCGRAAGRDDSFCPGCGIDLRQETPNQGSQWISAGSSRKEDVPPSSPGASSSGGHYSSREKESGAGSSPGGPNPQKQPSPGNRGLLFGIIAGGVLLGFGALGLALFLVFSTVGHTESTVPSLAGLTREQAREELRQAGLEVEVLGEEELEGENGVVSAQEPAAGAQVQPGDVVTISLAAAADTDQALGGLDASEPLFALARAGMLGLLESEEEEDEDDGEGYWATREVTCGVCGGDGDPWDGTPVPVTYYCGVCGGSGIVSQWSEAGYVDRWCGNCGGSGEVTEWGEPDRGVCDNCVGTGTVTEEYWVEN